MKPLKIKAGAKVALTCPASPVSENEIKTAVNTLKDLGFKPIVGEHVLTQEHYLAGTDEERAAELEAFFKNPEIAAIFCVRGGYGSARLLDILDFRIFQDFPKPFFGHSDITALSNAIFAKTELESYTGLILKAPPEAETLRTLEHCLSQLPLIVSHQNFLRKGVASGHLIGGNLTVFSHLLGTPYLPKLTGNILLLEDVGEEPYRIDRMLRHLQQAGVFSQVSGVIFGSFYHCESRNKNLIPVHDIICEYAEKFPCPVIIDFNYGHHPNTMVLPIGSMVEMSSLQGTVTFYD